MIKCNLAEIMLRKGVKIKDVAKSTGISRTTLTALSYNHSKGVQFDTFDKICSFLDIEPGELFSHFDFDYEVIEALESQNQFVFFLTLKFHLKDESFEGKVVVDWARDLDIFKLVIWKKLLYKLEVIPNSILVQLLVDFYQSNLTDLDMGNPKREIAIYEGETDTYLDNIFFKDDSPQQ